MKEKNKKKSKEKKKRNGKKEKTGMASIRKKKKFQ